MESNELICAWKVERLLIIYVIGINIYGSVAKKTKLECLILGESEHV